MRRFVSAALIAGIACGATVSAGEVLFADRPAHGVDLTVVSDNEIYVDGVRYGSWAEVAASGAYHRHGSRCGAPFDVRIDDDFESPSNCTGGSTTINPDYDPSGDRFRVPVVVHVIQSTSGVGFLSESMVQSQIDILNEDFQAIVGSNGGPGTDMNIEFFLADEDPSGNPTNGITYSSNNTWFNDSGNYYDTLAWDTNRYLNIYTNQASGALGYVSGFPTDFNFVGTNRDRVVVLYSAFGRNSPFSPFNLGRTATHEVGHYFGLYHTFQGGCGIASTPGCYTSGDRVCDTNAESSPFFGCSSFGRTTCGSPDPIDNYMDYSDDRCMNKFTAEQVNRMRCVLVNRRPDLGIPAFTGPCGVADFVEPIGQLTTADLNFFVQAFNVGGRQADLAAPFGDFSFADINAFLTAFAAGCP